MKCILNSFLFILLTSSYAHANKVLLMNNSEEQILADITWYDSNIRNKILMKPHEYKVAQSNGCIKTIEFYRKITFQKVSLTPKGTKSKRTVMQPVGNISISQFHFANTNGHNCPSQFDINKQLRVKATGGIPWQPKAKRLQPPSTNQVMDKLKI